MIPEKIKVIIADDNREFNFILAEYLNRQQGFEVTGIAYNGIEAIEKIVLNTPDIVILDLIMPQLDGVGVLKKIASLKLEKTPSFIMLTAVGKKEITQQALALGAKLYLQKPFDMEMLVEQINKIMNS